MPPRFPLNPLLLVTNTYRGGAQLMPDLISGEVQFYIGALAPALPHVKSGKLIGLAVTSARRSPIAMELPTMSEAGVKGHEVLEWNPVLGPAGLSAAVRDKLAAAVRRAMEDPEVLGRVRALGGDVFSGNAAEFLKSQQALWTQVVKERGISRD